MKLHIHIPLADIICPHCNISLLVDMGARSSCYFRHVKDCPSCNREINIETQIRHTVINKTEQKED